MYRLVHGWGSWMKLEPICGAVNDLLGDYNGYVADKAIAPELVRKGKLKLRDGNPDGALRIRLNRLRETIAIWAPGFDANNSNPGWFGSLGQIEICKELEDRLTKSDLDFLMSYLEEVLRHSSLLTDDIADPERKPGKRFAVDNRALRDRLLDCTFREAAEDGFKKAAQWAEQKSMDFFAPEERQIIAPRLRSSAARRHSSPFRNSSAQVVSSCQYFQVQIILSIFERCSGRQAAQLCSISQRVCNARTR
jgi:hypothetical protein